MWLIKCQKPVQPRYSIYSNIKQRKSSMFSHRNVWHFAWTHRRWLLWLSDERAFQPACQSITVIDSPVCLSDSGRHYFISADVLPLPHLHCGANSVHFLVQNKMPLSCILLTCSIDTAQSASLCLWRRRVLWHRGANMRNSLQTLAVLLRRHHRKRIVIRCTCT